MAAKRRTKLSPAKRKSEGTIVQQAAAQLPAGYGSFLEDVKARIQAARVKAAFSINREEPRARRVEGVIVIPLNEFLEALWNGEYA